MDITWWWTEEVITTSFEVNIAGQNTMVIGGSCGGLELKW